MAISDHASKDWTGAEAGKTIIVGGYSPHLAVLPQGLLDLGPVIGINKWAADFPCDYWIGSDTGLNWRKYFQEDVYPEEPKFLRDLDVPKFMKRPNRSTELFVPDDAGIFFSKAPHDQPISTRWDGRLRVQSSTAMSAIHLAIILGAERIILYGVDFVGSGRADGSEYGQKDFWKPHQNAINSLMEKFQKLVPIYKTNPESWLSCPLLEVSELGTNDRERAPEVRANLEPAVVSENKPSGTGLGSVSEASPAGDGASDSGFGMRDRKSGPEASEEVSGASLPRRSRKKRTGLDGSAGDSERPGT